MVESKVIMLGNTAVGKTTLLLRMRDSEFTDSLSPTVCGLSAQVDFNLGTVTEPEIFTFHLWDTAGHERYRSLTPVYSREARCVLLVYDITSRESFDTLLTWYDLVKSNVGKDCQYIIVGSKADLEDSESVAESHAESLKDKLKALESIIVSAKTGRGVDVLVRLIRDALSAPTQVEVAKVVSITETPPKAKKKFRC